MSLVSAVSLARDASSTSCFKRLVSSVKSVLFVLPGLCYHVIRVRNKNNVCVDLIMLL